MYPVQSKALAKATKKTQPSGKTKESDPKSSATDAKVSYEEMRERNIKTHQRVLEALKETVSLILI